MHEKMIPKLRDQLHKRRRELFEQVAHVESDRKGLENRAIETVDEAQREDLTRILNILEDRGRTEIKEINQALDRMAARTYGICELCRKQITLKRLVVMPATRLCRRCAQKYEKAQEVLQHPRDEIINDELLEAYRSLGDEKLPSKVFKLSRNESLMDLEEV